jgi:hypothetical protein
MEDVFSVAFTNLPSPDETYMEKGNLPSEFFIKISNLPIFDNMIIKMLASAD